VVSHSYLMNYISGSSPRQSGFTLVEFLIVIVIMGILAAVAAPRFFGDRTFLERGYFEELAAALRYAQKLAVASGCPVQMSIVAGGYVASQHNALSGSCTPNDASSSTGVALADGRVLSGSSPLGVSAMPNVTMVFDSLGRTNLAGSRTINVGPFALTVTADSGFVQTP
jgi:MSHA pilin protein MshC